MNLDLSRTEKLECARYGIIASLLEARVRMATLQALRRKTTNTHVEMEVLTSAISLLAHSLEFLDDLLGGGAVKKEMVAEMQCHQNKVYNLAIHMRHLVDDLLKPLKEGERRAVEEELKSLVFDD